MNDGHGYDVEGDITFDIGAGNVGIVIDDIDVGGQRFSMVPEQPIQFAIPPINIRMALAPAEAGEIAQVARDEDMNELEIDVEPRVPLPRTRFTPSPRPRALPTQETSSLDGSPSRGPRTRSSLRAQETPSPFRRPPPRIRTPPSPGRLGGRGGCGGGRGGRKRRGRGAPTDDDDDGYIPIRHTGIIEKNTRFVLGHMAAIRMDIKIKCVIEVTEGGPVNFQVIEPEKSQKFCLEFKDELIVRNNISICFYNICTRQFDAYIYLTEIEDDDDDGDDIAVDYNYFRYVQRENMGKLVTAPIRKDN